VGQKNKSNEIHITRIYEAPVKTVWEAWTDPNQVAKWWGPRGFTLTTHSKELKVGGVWHYTMHGPDGTDYLNKTIYHEVIPLSRLVYDHGGYDDRAPLFRVTMTFKEVKGQTQMNMTMSLPTPEEAEQTKTFIKLAGGNSTWDRLAEYLDSSLKKSTESFYINRSFEADIQTLFLMWTQPEFLSKWLAPSGMNMKFLKADIRLGGECFYSMTDGKEFTMFGKIHYREVTKYHRLVYTQNFSDEYGKTIRAPFSPKWPETMTTTVTLCEEGKNQTRVTVKTEVNSDLAFEEIETFIKEKPGMTIGWTGSFDKLEGCLQK